jgi:hypothetical protein
LVLLGCGCSNSAKEQESAETDSTALREDTVTAVAEEPSFNPDNYIFNFDLDSPSELAGDRREIYAWFPQHSDRLDFALKDVTHITFLQDLGLEELNVGAPGRYLGGSTFGYSVRMNLPGEKTALAFRFVADTLPGLRAQGEGLLGLFGVHVSDLLGPQVEIDRLLASTGRLSLLFIKNYLMGAMSCCELPPIFQMGLYGDLGDTVAVVVTFNRAAGKHIILVMGPNGSRAYAGHDYGAFRTERGEFHRDLSEFPYYYQSSDLTHVNLLLGFGWRGRRNVIEPILTARMF